MAVKATELYNADFFSQVGTEYICTGFMFGMVPEATMDKQLTKAGVFMAGQVATTGKQGEALTGHSADKYGYIAQQKGGGASTPGTTGMGGSKGGGSY
jgi:hypothetical protein